MSDSKDRRTEIALFRYTLILPLIRGEYSPGGKDRLRQQIASRPYDIPYSSRRSVSSTTLARWAVEQSGLTHLAVIHPDTVYGKHMAALFCQLAHPVGLVGSQGRGHPFGDAKPFSQPLHRMRRVA